MYPDIYWMGNAKIEQKAVRILQRISSVKLKMTKEIQAQPIYEYAAAIQSSINDSNKKLEKILRIQNKMKSLWDKVKVHRHQCEYLLQRSCEASTQIRALYNGNNFSGAVYSAPLIMSSLDSLVSSMKAGKELLQICGDHTEQEVALSLSSTPPYRDSFSRFGLVLRDLDWSLDVLLFLLHTLQAGFASRLWQVWLSKLSWSEERCRLVWIGDGENKAVSDADLVNSCLQADKERQACDRKELGAYLDSLLEAHTSRSGNPSLLSCLSFQNGRLKSEDNIRYEAFLRNRLHRDPSFRDPSGVPDCFWIPEKLDHVEIGFVGGGSFKSVHKCKWLGKQVAIATIHGGGEPSRTVLKAEAGLLARAQHQNVICFFGYTYDEEKQQGFLVTELMETDLRTLINNKLRTSQHHTSGAPFTLPVSIDILLQIVEAMIHVHECGVIHRDLKAQNCLVRCKSKGDGYVVKLIDFGESKLRTPEMGSNFKTRHKGTRSHMAPEVQGEAIEEYYTWSADVYSFAITCYEILTGAEEPFGKLAGRALTAMVCSGHRPTIPDGFPCPPGLVELMTKCWAQNSKDRPTFKEVRQILWNFKLYHTIWGTQ